MFEYDFHTYTPKSSSCNTEFITHGVLIGCFFRLREQNLCLKVSWP